MESHAGSRISGTVQYVLMSLFVTVFAFPLISLVIKQWWWNWSHKTVCVRVRAEQMPSGWLLCSLAQQTWQHSLPTGCWTLALKGVSTESTADCEGESMIYLWNLLWMWGTAAVSKKALHCPCLFLSVQCTLSLEHLSPGEGTSIIKRMLVNAAMAASRCFTNTA